MEKQPEMQAEQELQNDEEVVIVEVEGPNGEEEYYAQDIIIPYNGKQFAVLVSIPDDDAPEDEEPDLILARMDTTADGEIEYVSPEEDEFEAVQKLYDKPMCFLFATILGKFVAGGYGIINPR